MTSRLITHGFLPVASVLPVLLAASQAFAQATGQVATGTGPSSGARSLESLQQLLLSPPEPRLNLFVTPQYTHEKYEEYTEDGTFFDRITGAEGDEIDDLVRQPKFTIDTTGITAGADYLFEMGLLLGASVTYNHADYEFEKRSREELADDVLSAFIGGNPTEVSTAIGLGQPLDREYDEYGATAAIGYYKGPWTVLLTGSYSRHEDIKTKRREVSDFQINPILGVVLEEFVETEGNTDSDVYAAELGVAYRIGSDGASMQPSISIGYQREEVDGYTEEFDSAFQRVFPAQQQFMQVDEDDLIFSSTVREFNDQTIESIPLRAGVLFSAPLGDPAADFRLSNFVLGAAYTHDFEDQKRTVKGESINFPAFSVEYEEENRNQDFVSFIGALDFQLGPVRGTFTHQQDLGFDERERAYILRLQLRVPLSF